MVTALQERQATDWNLKVEIWLIKILPEFKGVKYEEALQKLVEN